MCRNIRGSRFSVRSLNGGALFLIVTFCGHRNLSLTPVERQRLIELMLAVVDQCPTVEFFLGGYGCFDGVCNELLRAIQKDHPGIKRVFVTPYLDPSYKRMRCAQDDFDEIVYPFETKVLYRYAIPLRNRWMVDRADYVIAAVRVGWGGAAKTAEYAIRKGKRFVNVVDEPYQFV